MVDWRSFYRKQVDMLRSCRGKVVDMFYFPLIDTTLPDWMPFWGGERFQFFRPVFNLADSAISVGVASIILFHRKFFKQEKKKDKASTPNDTGVQESILVPPVVTTQDEEE